MSPLSGCRRGHRRPTNALAAELGDLDRSFDLECDARWGPCDDTGDGADAGAGAGGGLDDVEVVASVLAHGVDPWSLAELMCIDPETLLDPIDRVAYLRAFDAVGHYVAAGQQRALVAVAGARSSGRLRLERHLEHEVAIARRTSRGRAGRDIELARTLRAEFRATAGTLERGEITLGHATALVAGTRYVASPQARAEVEARVLPTAATCTPAGFRRHVDAAVCALDPAGETRRHARARADRQVWVRRCANGLAELHVLDEWPVVNAMFERITHDATDLQRARRCQWRAEAASDPETLSAEPFDDDWVDRTLANCRADTLSTLVLRDDPDHDASTDDARAPTRRRGKPRIEGRLVIDLATLRGETENPCQLDGSPIPAPLARPLARDISHWRRMVTDPVDGHLLDYGRRTYLPDALRTYIAERDQTCRNPWCDQPAHLGHLDHATEYPAGPSNTSNTGALCTDCHRLKTDHAARLDHSAPDGSATWRTTWGQRVPIRPTRYLDTGGTTSRPRPVPGVLDRSVDPPHRRTTTPPDDPADTPPF